METNAEKEVVDNLSKLCASQEGRSNSRSNIQELQANQELSCVHKRVSREDHNNGAEGKYSFVSPLNRQLSVKLDDLADSCSDLSLFHNEVSSEDVQTSKVPIPISNEVLSVAPIMYGHPVMFVLGSTTPEENELLVKESMVDVTKATLKLVDPHLTKLDSKVSELIESFPLYATTSRSN